MLSSLLARLALLRNKSPRSFTCLIGRQRTKFFKTRSRTVWRRIERAKFWSFATPNEWPTFWEFGFKSGCPKLVSFWQLFTFAYLCQQISTVFRLSWQLQMHDYARWPQSGRARSRPFPIPRRSMPDSGCDWRCRAWSRRRRRLACHQLWPAEHDWRLRPPVSQSLFSISTFFCWNN